MSHPSQPSFYLIIVAIFGEQYKLLSFLLCIFLQLFVTSCLVDSGIPPAPNSVTPCV